MQKTYPYNSKLKNENKVEKKLHQTSYSDIKNVVDINILLNRVKIEEKNQTKRKLIFFSLVTTALFLFGSLISILK